MESNGKLLTESTERFSIPPTTGKWQSWLAIITPISFVLFFVAVVFEAVWVMPNMQATTELLKKERDEEIKRAKIFEDAHKRQLIQEADFLLLQHKNIEAAKELNRLLKKGD